MIYWQGQVTVPVWVPPIIHAYVYPETTYGTLAISSISQQAGNCWELFGVTLTRNSLRAIRCQSSLNIAMNIYDTIFI